jgi:hypothetical protein
MKNIKKIASLVLIFMMVLSISIPASAATSPGGTWEITDYETDESIIDFPIQVVYLPKDQVKAIGDALIKSDDLIKFIRDFGVQGFTKVIADKVKAKYAISLHPLLTWGYTCFQLAEILADAHFRNDFLDAKNSSSSGTIKYTTYRSISGDVFYEFDVWDGTYMPTRIDFRYTNGYAYGKITVGVFKMPSL